MPDIGYVDRTVAAPVVQTPSARYAARMRGVLLLIVCMSALAGWLVTNPEAAHQAVAQSGPELTRLLRAMAGMKAMAAVGLVAVILWRLDAPVTRARFTAYGLACAAMAAGPALIWGMAHLKLGALLLHAGLFVSVVMLFRDPAMGARLEAVIARRRAALLG